MYFPHIIRDSKDNYQHSYTYTLEAKKLTLKIEKNK